MKTPQNIWFKVFLILFWVACTSRAAVIFSDGFESGLGTWQVGDANPTGTPAYWNVVNSAFGGENTRSGTNKIYCAGTGFTGTSTAPKYRDDMSAYLRRSVNLAGYTNATLSFWYKIPTIESFFDNARVYVDDTIIWERSNVTTAWTQTNLSLNAFLGGTRVLKFEFQSDISNTDEGWYLDDISITDAYTPGPPPANDDFNFAQGLKGAQDSVNASNFEATSEPGETEAYRTIWYHWTPTTNGTVTFRTGGSNFDTVLCVYTGNSLTNLTAVACDDNGDTNNASLVSFYAVSGTTYRISVGGHTSGDRGFVMLNWSQPVGIGQALLPDLFIWADQTNEYLYGWYLDRTTISNHTLLRLSTATPNVGLGSLELRGDTTVAGVYQRIMISGVGFEDRYAGTFTFHSGHGHLHFDNWVNFHLRAVLTNEGVGDIVVSGDKTSFAVIDLRPYNTNLPNGEVDGHYDSETIQGTTIIQGLSVGWADIYDAALQDQWIDITGVPPGKYWLEAIVDPANSIWELNETNNAARILIELGVPPNNNFTNATLLTGFTAGLIDFNIDATKESGEPNHATNAGGRSVWYKWTAPSNMTVTISTEGSGFDTLLAVYTGTAVNALTLRASNNNISSSNRASRVTFSAVAGTVYRIAVDGAWSTTAVESGRLELHLNPAWNDHFSNAVLLSGVSGSVIGSSRGATRQAGEPMHAEISGSNSVWYSWTASNAAPVTFDTIESGFDTLLGVYTGTNVSTLTLVTNDNDSAGNYWSRVTFSPIAGGTYYIAVDGPNGTNGVVKLGWSVATPPTITIPPASTNAYEGATVSFSVSVSGSGPFTYQWKHEGTLLSDNKNISGAASSRLTLHKISTNDNGAYMVTVTNSAGAATSVPANLIVLDNPRVVFISEDEGHIGGVVKVPIEMQAVGNEHALDFSVSYDTNILNNPRLLGNPLGATIATNTGVTNGRFGLTLTLAGDQTLTEGEHLWTTILFDAATGLSNGVMTSIGFVDQPTEKRVTDTNGASLVTLFASGFITLHAIQAVETGTRLPDGRFQVSLSGVAGRSYRIDASDDLVIWNPLSTNQVDLEGVMQVIDGQSTNLVRRFYRAVLLP